MKLGDNSRIIVNSKGKMRMKIGTLTQVITRVYYILELKNLLLSIGQLEEMNLTVAFKQNVCKVYHPEKGLITHYNMSSNCMFVIFVSIVFPGCFNVACDDITYL